MHQAFPSCVLSKALLWNRKEKTRRAFVKTQNRILIRRVCALNDWSELTILKEGSTWSAAKNDMYVAKPSFSQMLFHQFIVTRFPNHCRQKEKMWIVEATMSCHTLSLIQIYLFFFIQANTQRGFLL